MKRKNQFMIVTIAGTSPGEDIIHNRLCAIDVRPATWLETLRLRVHRWWHGRDAQLRTPTDTGCSIGVHIDDQQYEALVGTRPCSIGYKHAADQRTAPHRMDLIVSSERGGSHTDPVNV